MHASEQAAATAPAPHQLQLHPPLLGGASGTAPGPPPLFTHAVTMQFLGAVLPAEARSGTAAAEAAGVDDDRLMPLGAPRAGRRHTAAKRHVGAMSRGRPAEAAAACDPDPSLPMPSFALAKASAAADATGNDDAAATTFGDRSFLPPYGGAALDAGSVPAASHGASAPMAQQDDLLYIDAPWYSHSTLGFALWLLFQLTLSINTYLISYYIKVGGCDHGKVR
jgi:hypothetical protein